jgi:hypothetical protein
MSYKCERLPRRQVITNARGVAATRPISPAMRTLDKVMMHSVEGNALDTPQLRESLRRSRNLEVESDTHSNGQARIIGWVQDGKRTSGKVDADQGGARRPRHD